MRSLLKSICIGIAACGIVAGCSSDDAMKEAHIEGKITVADSIDATGNYANIGINIIKRDSTAAGADTLFSAVTGSGGRFSGTASFKDKKQYLMIISRNDKDLGRTGIILADQDSMHITAELPGLSQTLNIKSHEHAALQTYQRVNRSFRRVGIFARAGRLQGDSLAAELEKWPGIYWDVYKNYPKTITGSLAAGKAVELLSQWDQPEMMQKLEQIEGRDKLVYLAASYGAEYKAKHERLDSALIYLKELESKTELKQPKMRIQMERIELLYDSARVDVAQQVLKSFKKEFNSIAATKWAQSIEYNLNYLSPGDAIPSFSFIDQSQKISRENLKGSPYLLEIAALSSPRYQRQYDRTVIIHSLYKSYGLKVITIPLDTSKVTVQAFFEERVRPWPVASASSFNMQELIKRFNINRLPTRFLVDREGRIVRRYVGEEYENIIQGIQKITKNK